mmetsp:Transcript_19654/g.23372  ORF Transcript_19654/g.23372 Transcript_19654/m.23372 type:complete len:458 (-) Transcript_19654:457-1830(-)
MSTFQFKENKSPSNSWLKAPVIIGGTGGSGTRGVVDVLTKLGIYLYPSRHSQLFKECYNGEALDNVAMYPESGQLDGLQSEKKTAQKSYSKWLLGNQCSPPNVSIPFVLSGKGRKYLGSIPEPNRKRYRWGWKNPKTIYHLHVLLSMYPDMVFIQVLRNPFDMASVQYEHLHNRALEFSDLNGGFEETAALSNFRCLTISPNNPKACLVSSSALKTISECRGPHTDVPKCVKQTDTPKPSPWRCLDMQLWAQINAAAYVYGVRCLNDQDKFLLWHGEDVYGMRGEGAQLKLQERITDVLGLDGAKVALAFTKERTQLNHRRLSRTESNNGNQLNHRRFNNEWSRRRLGYGKYKESSMNLTLAYSCAEAAVPGVMSAFHYSQTDSQTDSLYGELSSDLNGLAFDDNKPSMVTTKRRDSSEDTLNEYLLVFGSAVLLLLWIRRKHFAEPSLDTIDCLTL